MSKVSIESFNQILQAELPSAAESGIYLREINETSLLSADEEKELARAIAQGDVRA